MIVGGLKVRIPKDQKRETSARIPANGDLSVSMEHFVDEIKDTKGYDKRQVDEITEIKCSSFPSNAQFD